jgi:hypothetical protein
MIEFARSYKTADGQLHATIEAAQQHEVAAMLAANKDHTITEAESKSLAELIMRSRERLMDIFTTTDSSRPKARKINGGTRKRKSAPAPATTETTAPIV